jgi:hypothetical protein
MFKNITQVKQANKAQGGHFFNPQAMRFFNSKVESGVIAGRYFVTSERYDPDSPKRFTIREVAPSGEIVGDLGGFQRFESVEGALLYLGRYMSKIGA